MRGKMRLDVSLGSCGRWSVSSSVVGRSLVWGNGRCRSISQKSLPFRGKLPRYRRVDDTSVIVYAGATTMWLMERLDGSAQGRGDMRKAPLWVGLGSKLGPR